MGKNVILEDDEVEYLDGLIAYKLEQERKDYRSMVSSMDRDGLASGKGRPGLINSQAQHVALLERIISKLRACG